jgi:hypothetical protein
MGRPARVCKQTATAPERFAYYLPQMFRTRLSATAERRGRTLFGPYDINCSKNGGRGHRIEAGILQ